MTAEAAWDYAIGMIKVDGLEPTEDLAAIWKVHGFREGNTRLAIKLTI